MRISLLDRSRTRAGEPDAAAIATTLERAVRADAGGFHRFWTAEHHAVPGIAASAPTVLLAAIGAHTSRIRIGSGGVMVPNHRPLVIAEQALLLEALYPGRIDLGLGGSLGFTPAVRRELGRDSMQEGEYAAEIERVREFLEGRAAITARPRGAAPPLFLLAIRDGLSLAAQLGLPVVVGGPAARRPGALAEYRQNFVPSGSVPEPYVIVSVDVSVADTTARARELLLPEAWAFADSREVGEFRALQPLEDVQRMLSASRSPKKTAAVRAWADSAVAGTPREVSDELARIVESTGADELMVSVSAFDRDDVATTDEFLGGLAD